MHSCSKHIRVISIFVLKNIHGISKIYIMGDIAWIFPSLKDKTNVHNLETLELKKKNSTESKAVKRKGRNILSCIRWPLSSHDFLFVCLFVCLGYYAVSKVF